MAPPFGHPDDMQAGRQGEVFYVRFQQPRREDFGILGLAVRFVINVAVASFIVNVIEPPGHISPRLWANIGAFSATLISVLWNFWGYKFIVFKK